MFWKRRIYLDYAAAMPLRGVVARPARAFANPSSPHEEGRAAKAVLEAARREIARLTEVKADDVVFTGGATEANAIAMRGVVGACTGETHVLFLPSSHASIVENAKMLSRMGATVEPLPIAEGKVDIKRLKTMLRPHTVLVSMDAVCGETGTLWNTREVAHALKLYAPSAKLHVDASQAPLVENISRSHFGADMLVFDASKVGGLRGVGCLIAARTIALAPLYAGGGQERGLRPGTESPALAAAFAAALDACVRERANFKERAVSLRQVLVSFIIKNVPAVHINEWTGSAPHILNLSLPGRDTDYLVALLDEAGFAVSTRSACETDAEDGSKAVFALWGDQERAKTTLRISWGPSVSEKDLLRFGRALAKEVAFVDKESL